MFADDVSLFCKADMGSIKAIVEKFYKLSTSSSLEANVGKCEVYFAGVGEDVQNNIYDNLKMKLD